MAERRFTLPPLYRSLSARLLLLTVTFVMLAEVLIFAPSIGRFRLTFLEERLAAASLAVLALEATPDRRVSEELAMRLLDHVPAYAARLSRLHRPTLSLMQEVEHQAEAHYDLREANFFSLIGDALAAMDTSRDRTLHVIGVSPRDSGGIVEIVMDEGPLQDAMWSFAYRILALSLIISLITATLVYLALHRLLVRPLECMTENMIAFRDDPEDEARIIVPSGRGDEIGLAERQLKDMQRALRASLHQKTRLAAVGVAATKINHDLRNILATAQLASDRLAASADPDVRRMAPGLLHTLDRAIELCAQILKFTREGPVHLDISRFDLAELLSDVGGVLPLPENRIGFWRSRVGAGTMIEADRAQLFRVLHNLGANALQAGATEVQVVDREEDGALVLEISDNGPGLSPRARDSLFQPFASTRSGGTGLGLAIAREILRAHGGEIMLARSDGQGTSFCLRFPLRQRRLSLPDAQAVSPVLVSSGGAGKAWPPEHVR